MSRVYYEIQLTARQLSFGLVLFVLLLIAAFLLGYGAGQSLVPATRPAGPGSEGPLAETVIPPAAGVTPSEGGGAPTPAGALPSPTPETTHPATPTRKARPTPSPVPTVTPPARRTAPRNPASETRGGYWVQVLAARHAEAVASARAKLVELDFPRGRHWILQAPTAEGTILYKVRVGPFPDRDSAERVTRRMQASGFPDAWVVVP